MRRPTRQRNHTIATCHDGHAIGLDLGATSVRAAVLAVRQRDGQPVVEAQAVVGAPLPPGAVVGGVVTDQGAVAAALKQLWSGHKLKCRNVVLGVANPQVLVRELEMPDLGPAERAQALPFQARELIAMSLDQMVLDFAPLGPVSSDTQMQQGLLVACPREPVLAAIAAVEAAGLKVARVDLASFALLRSVTDGRDDVEVAIDIGADLTTVAVHQLGVPRLVRTLPRGGAELTNRLAGRLKIDVAQAEEAKRRLGLTSPDPASALLRDLVTSLLAEIRSSLNYFRVGHPGAQIQRVVLTGGGSALAGLPELMSEQVGAPCEVAATERLLVPPRRAKRGADHDLRWVSALSVGLAIGAAA